MHQVWLGDIVKKLTTIMIVQDNITIVNTITIALIMNVIKSNADRSATAMHVKLCNKFTSVNKK